MLKRKANVMIKELKNTAAGTEIKGLPLMIKTARNTFRDAEGTTFQEVVFMDSSGEMTGNILLEVSESDSKGYRNVDEFIRWKSKTNLCIMDGILQDTNERKKEGVKLVVYECFDAATPLSYEQHNGLQEEEWRQLREDEVRGKIRHGLCCATLSAGSKVDKEYVLELQEFIMTGRIE